MNGPEHYREAERLMAKAFDGDTMFTPDVRARLLYGAQVHATLALAAATASPLVDKYMGDSDRTTDWGVTIGWNTAPERATADEVVEATIYCGASEGATGIDCGRPDGHEDDHEGTASARQTETVGYPLTVRWPRATVQPCRCIADDPCGCPGETNIVDCLCHRDPDNPDHEATRQDLADLRAKLAAPADLTTDQKVPEAACGAVREETGIKCGKPAGHTDHHKGTGTDEHGEPMASLWSNTEADHG